MLFPERDTFFFIFDYRGWETKVTTEVGIA